MCDRAECQQWVHIKCGGITPEEYEELKNSSPSKKTVWFCSVCENLNLMTSFSSNDSFPTDNSFSVLSDSQLEEESIGSDDDDDNESNLSSQSSASSTTTSSENSNSPRSKPKFRKLKLMLVNVCSVKSKRKQRDLHALFEQEDPDIVCGTESHVDSDHFTSEIFPTTHDYFRKDRDKFGGGVFIGVKKDLLAMQDDSMNADCESIWVKIVFAGKQPLHIGSFYRPTNSDPIPLVKLDESLKKLTGKATLPNIILAGDFNAPDINWENNTINKNPQYGVKLNQTLLDTANDNMLSQLQHTPTRGDNVLDIVFTTIPDQITNIDTVPGISDHDAVTVQLDTTVKYARKKPRTVYLYRKGNMEGLKEDMEIFKDSFLQSNPLDRDVETNWTSFKDELFKQMDKHIPQKKLSSWQDTMDEHYH